MTRELEAFEAATDIPGMASVHEVSDAGMGRARAVEDGFAFRLAIGLPDLLDVQDGNHDPLGVAQGDLRAAGLEGFGKGFSDVEGDRDRPKQTAGKMHVATHALVVGLGHEAGERREAAIEKHLEIADLARSQIPGGKIAGGGFGFGRVLAIENKVDELAAVRRDEMAGFIECIQRCDFVGKCLTE